MASSPPATNMHRRPNNPFAQRSARGGSGSKRVSYSGDPRYGPQVTQRHHAHSMCNPLVILTILGASVYAIYSFTLSSPSPATTGSSLIEGNKLKTTTPKKSKQLQQQPPLSELSSDNADFQDISKSRKRDETDEEKLPYQPANVEEESEPTEGLEDSLNLRHDNNYNDRDNDNNNDNNKNHHGPPSTTRSGNNGEDADNHEDPDDGQVDEMEKFRPSDKEEDGANNDPDERVDEDPTDKTIDHTIDSDHESRKFDKKKEAVNKETHNRVKKDKKSESGDRNEYIDETKGPDDKDHPPPTSEEDEANDRRRHKSEDTDVGPHLETSVKQVEGDGTGEDEDNDLGVGPKQHGITLDTGNKKDPEEDSLPMTTDGGGGTDSEDKLVNADHESTGPQHESVSRDSILPMDKKGKPKTKVDGISDHGSSGSLANTTQSSLNTTNDSTIDETVNATDTFTFTMGNTSDLSTSANTTDDASNETLRNEGTQLNMTNTLNETESLKSLEQGNSSSTPKRTEIDGLKNASAPIESGTTVDHSNRTNTSTGFIKEGNVIADSAYSNETVYLESNSSSNHTNWLPIVVSDAESANTTFPHKSKSKNSTKKTPTTKGKSKKKKEESTKEDTDALGSSETGLVNSTNLQGATEGEAMSANATFLDDGDRNVTESIGSLFPKKSIRPQPDDVPPGKNVSLQREPRNTSKTKAVESIKKPKDKNKKNLRSANSTLGANASATGKIGKSSLDKVMEAPSQDKGRKGKKSQAAVSTNETDLLGNSSSSHTTKVNNVTKGNKADKSKSKKRTFPFLSGLPGAQVKTALSNTSEDVFETLQTNISIKSVKKGKPTPNHGKGKTKKGSQKDNSKAMSNQGSKTPARGRGGSSEGTNTTKARDGNAKKRRRLRVSSQDHFTKTIWEMAQRYKKVTTSLLQSGLSIMSYKQ